MTWVCRFLHSDVASTSRHAATAKADQASNGPSHPANHVCHPSQRPLPCHHHNSHFQHNHWPIFHYQNWPCPTSDKTTVQPLQPTQPTTKKIPLSSLTSMLEVLLLGPILATATTRKRFFILFSPQMSTPAASWSSCLPMWFQGLLRTSVFFAPVRRRSRAFTTEALSFTEWSTGWCLFS